MEKGTAPQEEREELEVSSQKEASSSPLSPREIYKTAFSLITALLIIFLVAFSIFYSLFWIYMKYWHKEETIVPSVERLPLEQASKVLYAANLVPEVEGYVESDIPEMRVAKQVPYPGMKTVVGRKVKLFLSLGSQGIKMPDLFGMKIDDLKEVLDNLHLRYTVYAISTNIVPPGIVLDQIPDPGTPITPNTRLSLFVSSPPKDIPLSDTLGEPIYTLARTLIERDIEVYEINYKPIKEGELFSPLEVTEIYTRGEMLKATVALRYNMPVEIKELSFSVNIPPTKSRVKVAVMKSDYLGERVIFKAYLKGPTILKLDCFTFGKATIKVMINDKKFSEFSY